MNDLYTRDRMERNQVDFEGCGIGSGRYDKREERSEKLKEIMLPIAILVFLLFAWAALIFESYPHIYYRVFGEKAEGVVVSDTPNTYQVSWVAPDGVSRGFRTPRGIRVINGKTDVYYIKGDYETGSAIFPIEYWAPFYIIMAIVTLFMIVWIKRTLVTKKHAVYEQKEHSYKDY